MDDEHTLDPPPPDPADRIDTGPDPTGPGTGHERQEEPAEATATAELPPVGHSGEPAAAARPHRLRRDMEHRLLGGVAAGLARYLDIDVVIVRVVFAVLTVLGGSGALIYVAAWLLVPADDEEETLAQSWVRHRTPRRSLVAIVLGVVIAIIAISDLVSGGPWWPHPVGGVGLTFGAVALVLAVALVAGSGPRGVGSRLRWFLLMFLLAIVAVAVVAAATVFSIEAASGVPLRGGIGNTQVHPTSTGQLQHTYRLAIGNLEVDMSAVAFPAGTTRVTATVGVGRVLVEVPPGPTVSVVARSGLGDVQLFGQDDGGLSTTQTTRSSGSRSTSHLVVDADAGVGQVQVVRTGAGFS